MNLNICDIIQRLMKRCKHMNVDSEQITLDKSLVFAQDQPLSNKNLQECLINVLGRDKCKVLNVPPRKWVLEYVVKKKVYHLLVRPCTYLGNPHPLYKKRVQLPLWFNEYTNSINKKIQILMSDLSEYITMAIGIMAIILCSLILKKIHTSQKKVTIRLRISIQMIYSRP